jgi:hypothetical protein
MGPVQGATPPQHQQLHGGQPGRTRTTRPVSLWPQAQHTHGWGAYMNATSQGWCLDQHPPVPNHATGACSVPSSTASSTANQPTGSSRGGALIRPGVAHMCCTVCMTP